MTRNIFISFLLLTAVIGGMLGWQWHIFSSDQVAATIASELPITQSIEIYDRDNQLVVNQAIFGLKKGEYTLIPPVYAKKTNVTVDAKIKPIQNNRVHLEEDTESEVNISYSIQKKSPVNEFILEHWTYQMEETIVKNTDVLIYKEGKQKGEWLAGSDIAGMKRTEHADYFHFSSVGGEFPLYFSNVSFQSAEINDSITLFAEDMKSDWAIEAGNKLQSIQLPKKTAVILNKHTAGIVQPANLFVLANEKELAALPDRVKALDIYSEYPFHNPNEQWMAYILSNLKNAKEEGNDKAKKITVLLKAVLDENQQHTFVESSMADCTSISAKMLDEKLGEALSAKTDFFQINAVEGKGVLPLILYDSRNVLVNGNKADDRLIAHFQDKRYYNLEILAEGLKYKYSKVDNTTFSVRGNNKHYLFYLEENLFIVNGQEYGVLSKPIRQINGKAYMGEKWIKEIFGLTLKETEEQIDINRL